jgi:hypothetical protein
MSDPHVLGAGLLPTPFSADEIREGCPEGRTIRLLVEPAQGAPFERVNRFVDCDESGATLERWRLSADGSVDGEPERARTTWLDLQSHASFPADRATRSRETIELPIGRVECLRYDVRAAAHDDAPLATFWFALDHPGMPVRYEQPAGAGVDRTTMVSDQVG